MALKIPSISLLPRSLHNFPPRQNPNLKPLPLSPTISHSHLPHHFSSLSISALHRTQFVTARAIQPQQLTGDEGRITEASEEAKIEDEAATQGVEKELANQGIWIQLKEIVKFTAPATGLWICGPLMSLIDTAVIGQGSSIELAALGIDN
jgi:hypothetical protein